MADVIVKFFTAPFSRFLMFWVMKHDGKCFTKFSAIMGSTGRVVRQKFGNGTFYFKI